MEELPSNSDTKASPCEQTSTEDAHVWRKSERKCGEQLREKKFSHILKAIEIRQSVF